MKLAGLTCVNKIAHSRHRSGSWILNPRQMLWFVTRQNLQPPYRRNLAGRLIPTNSAWKGCQQIVRPTGFDSERWGGAGITIRPPDGSEVCRMISILTLRFRSLRIPGTNQRTNPRSSFKIRHSNTSGIQIKIWYY